jgi:hypothetical protein
MSTRAGITVKDANDSLHFYRHCDGYPDHMLPTLNILLDWVKAGKIRDNVGQASGWLVIIGALEYGTIPHIKGDDLTTLLPPKDWKAGAFEPTTNVADHGDLDYIYTIDLIAQTITYKSTH